MLRAGTGMTTSLTPAKSAMCLYRGTPKKIKIRYRLIIFRFSYFSRKQLYCHVKFPFKSLIKLRYYENVTKNEILPSLKTLRCTKQNC